MSYRTTLATLVTLSICLGLGACATPEWRTITDIKEIAATRTAVNNSSSLDLSRVIILRLQRDGKRVEVTSIAPSVIGAAKDGPPGARTVFALSPERDKLVLFGQNVPERQGFHQQIPLSELQPGKRFRFPVVQEDGRIAEQEFTVEGLISQP